jgi:DNA-directed RNA polymerase specialized sigma24 family protein
MWQRWALRAHQDVEINRRYVICAAMNCVIDYYRYHRRLTELDHGMDLAVNEPGYSEIVDDAAPSRILNVLHAQPVMRRAVGMMIIEGYTYGEIAAVLNVNTSTVRSHVQALRDALRPWLAPDEPASGSIRKRPTDGLGGSPALQGEEGGDG